MRDPDITTLRLFVAVCDAGNIARAAEQQHIVASAVSKRLAALEQTLGTPLLERRRGGVAPTAAGRRCSSTRARSCSPSSESATTARPSPAVFAGRFVSLPARRRSPRRCSKTSPRSCARPSTAR
jgi:hypothetical protein